MATNVYRSQQRIDFDPAKPAIYYGWYIETTPGGMSVHPFRTLEQQEAHISLVERSMNDPSIPRGTVEVAAAYVACAEWGDTEDDREWARELVGRDFPEHVDVFNEIEFEEALEDELYEILRPDTVQPPEGARPRAGVEIPVPQPLAEALNRAGTRER